MTATSVPPANPKHLRGLPQVATIATLGFRKTQAIAADAAELGEIAVIAGDPGLGKSFAVYHFVSTQELPWVWLDMPPRPRPKEVVVRLLRALSGPCDSRPPVYELADELCEVLAEQPRVVVIDDAQNLDMQGLHQLRYLHDRDDARWALLFTGGVGCEGRLASDPQLDDRIAGRVRFGKLEGATLLEALDAYSPFFAKADRQLLLRADQVFAKGVFRRWARMLQIGARLAEASGTDRLTPNIAKAAIAKARRVES